MKIVIETPRGSREKFKYEPGRKTFVADKTLPGEMVFPFDFGFIPHSRGEDGDPLDVLLISGSTHRTGTILDCRIIGCMPAKQTDAGRILRNDRFIAVPAETDKYASLTSVDQLPEETVSSIQSFFISYLAAEDKHVVFLPLMDAGQAKQLLQQANA